MNEQENEINVVWNRVKKAVVKGFFYHSFLLSCIDSKIWLKLMSKKTLKTMEKK